MSLGGPEIVYDLFMQKLHTMAIYLNEFRRIIADYFPVICPEKDKLP